MPWIDLLFVLITLIEFSVPQSFKIALDDPAVCRFNSWELKWLQDDTSAIIIARSIAENRSSMSRCQLIIGPHSDAKKQYLKIRFESFYIQKCVVRLDILQASGTEVDKATTMAVLTCKSSTPDDLYTEPNYSVFLKIRKSDPLFLGYNFRINISLSDGPPPESISVTTVAVISVSLVAVVLVALYLVQKKFYIQRKYEDRQEMLESRASRQRTRSRSSVEELTELGSSPRRPRDRNSIANGEAPSSPLYMYQSNALNQSPRDRPPQRSLFSDSVVENDSVFVDDSVLPGSNDEVPPAYEAPPPYNEAIEMEELRQNGNTNLQKDNYANL